MWKKDAGTEPAAPARPMPPQATAGRAAAPARESAERATIGRSITINGEVTGDEDLLIQGRVEGSVSLEQHAVTVGPEGRVKADVTARLVTVEGTVEGNISATEQVVLRSSALVRGDIFAPRVVLEDGALFRGGVDMGETLERGGRAPNAKPRSSSTALNMDGAASGENARAAEASDASLQDTAAAAQGGTPRKTASGGRS